MINGSKVLDHPIRWAMVGGGKGSQIGYIHRSAALRDNNVQLVAGAFDINPERGMAFAAELGIDPDRCYPDYKTMFEKETQREDGIEAGRYVPDRHRRAGLSGNQAGTGGHRLQRLHHHRAGARSAQLRHLSARRQAQRRLPEVCRLSHLIFLKVFTESLQKSFFRRK